MAVFFGGGGRFEGVWGLWGGGGSARVAALDGAKEVLGERKGKKGKREKGKKKKEKKEKKLNKMVGSDGEGQKCA